MRFGCVIVDERFPDPGSPTAEFRSALSQQLARLERELGVLLLDRSTHHVKLTSAGSAFLVEARQILAHVSRAAIAARRAADSTPALRVGIVDAGYDSMPRILREVQGQFPELEIHQVEIGVPGQFELLADGRLDVGFGRASLAPAEIDFELVRLDPLGVLIARELRIGRPDLPGDYDDGGLVDLNNAPAAMIAMACELTQRTAEGIVTARTECGGFLTVEDLFSMADIPIGAWDMVRDRGVVIAPTA